MLLGVNALVGGFVQQLAQEVKSLAASYDNIDDIVADFETAFARAGLGEAAA